MRVCVTCTSCTLNSMCFYTSCTLNSMYFLHFLYTELDMFLHFLYTELDVFLHFLYTKLDVFLHFFLPFLLPFLLPKLLSFHSSFNHYQGDDLIALMMESVSTSVPSATRLHAANSQKTVIFILSTCRECNFDLLLSLQNILTLPLFRRIFNCLKL
jgi:hypothetical protein